MAQAFSQIPCLAGQFCNAQFWNVWAPSRARCVRPSIKGILGLKILAACAHCGSIHGFPSRTASWTRRLCGIYCLRAESRTLGVGKNGISLRLPAICCNADRPSCHLFRLFRRSNPKLIEKSHSAVLTSFIAENRRFLGESRRTHRPHSLRLGLYPPVCCNRSVKPHFQCLFLFLRGL